MALREDDLLASLRGVPAPTRRRAVSFAGTVDIIVCPEVLGRPARDTGPVKLGTKTISLHWPPRLASSPPSRSDGLARPRAHRSRSRSLSGDDSDDSSGPEFIPSPPKHISVKMPTFRRMRSSTTVPAARPCLSPSAHNCDEHDKPALRTTAPCPIVSATPASAPTLSTRSGSPSDGAALSPTRAALNDCCRSCTAAYEYGLRPDDLYAVRWTKRGAAKRQRQLLEARPVTSVAVLSPPSTAVLEDEAEDVPPEPRAASLNVDEVAVIHKRRSSNGECPAAGSPPMLARPIACKAAESQADADTTGPLRRSSSTPTSPIDEDEDDDAPPLLRRQTMGEHSAFGSLGAGKSSSSAKTAPSSPSKRSRISWRSLVAIPVPAPGFVQHF